MPYLKTLNTVPPGGWRYLQPGTNVWFRERSWDVIVKKITTHREYKGIDVGDVPRDIQDQICMSLGPEHCRPYPGETWEPVEDRTNQLSPGMVLSLSKGILSFIKSGAQWVEPSEAERRAEICRSCPFNKPAAMCSCSAAYKVINAAVPAEKVPEGIDVCMACGCSLKAKVNLPLSVIKDSIQNNQKFPGHCWQLEALEK